VFFSPKPDKNSPSGFAGPKKSKLNTETGSESNSDKKNGQSSKPNDSIPNSKVINPKDGLALENAESLESMGVKMSVNMDSSQSGGEDEPAQDNVVFLYYHDHDNDSEDEKFSGIHKIECNTFWEIFESGRILGEVIPIP
jgi:hypothetical protein